jgi:hypothetical protein
MHTFEGGGALTNTILLGISESLCKLNVHHPCWRLSTRHDSVLYQTSNQSQPAFLVVLFIFELPRFRLYGAILGLYVYWNKQTT